MSQEFDSRKDSQSIFVKLSLCDSKLSDLHTLITTLSSWLLFPFFGTKASPSGLISAINDHALLITSCCAQIKLVK